MKDDFGPTAEPKAPSMDLKEFKAAGFLQEVNRRFFHPLGLSLSMRTDESGDVAFHNVWDFRDDEEGFVFGNLTDEERERGRRIDAEFERRLRIREASLGFGIEPL